MLGAGDWEYWVSLAVLLAVLFVVLPWIGRWWT